MDFNKTADVTEKILSSRSLDGWEIYQVASRNLSIEVKEQKVDSLVFSEPVGVSVRVLKDGKMGFSFSTSLDPADLERMVENALVGALNQSPDDCLALSLPGEYPVLDGMYDEGLSRVREEEKVAFAMELERLVLSADARIRKVRKAGYGESSYEVAIRNSYGVSGSYRGTSVSASVSPVAEEGGDSQMGWDFGFGTSFSSLDINSIASGAAGRATGQLGARKISTLRCPAVMDNHVASDILEVLAPSFLAENVQKGKSLLKDKEGQKLFSTCIRISDDGLRPGGMATAPFDGEGVAKRNTLLVEEGVLQGYLYDICSARRSGKNSTGNAARGGIKAPPRIGVNNFYLEKGSRPFEVLLQEIDRGVLITSVMGMHTANPVSGDFSVGAAGFFIENGVISYPVKGIAISGNLVDLYRNVVEVGNDLRFFGAVGSPSVRLEYLDISGE